MFNRKCRKTLNRDRLTEMRRIKVGGTASAVGGLLVVHSCLLLYLGAATSPTFDEPGHLAAGLYTWRSGNCDLYTVNPPLVKVIAAAPLLIAGAEEDWSQMRSLPMRPEFDVGEDFVAANGARILWLTTLARWACLPFSVLGGLVCYLWSSRLFGKPSGMIALTLWCFSPTILGNGALITADMASAAVGVLAGYLYWRWLEEPSWEGAFVNGAALGLCWLVKLTWVILPGTWLLVWLARHINRNDRKQPARTALSQWCVSCVIGVCVLNVGYGFEGTFCPLGEYTFESSFLNGLPHRPIDPRRGNRFRGTALGSLPVPLPSSFVHGFDSQKQDFEESRMLYFAGERNEEGWWYFYLLAFLLKEPPGLLVLVGMAVLCFLQGTERSRRFLRLGAVWIPLAILLLLVSVNSHLNYYRYAIPALPFAFVWISQVGRWFADRRRIPQVIVAVSLLSYVASGALSVPHSLSYVNWFGGGMDEGHRWFADANFDWGQDLPALKHWQDTHPEVERLSVGYFGTINPREMGIEYDDLSRELCNPAHRAADYRIPPGWYAISATHVHGIGRHVLLPQGEGVRTVFDAGLSIFEGQTPVDRAGPSILIYHIEE